MDGLSWIAWLNWDPPREAFFIPFFHHPIFWYGILFVAGFVLGYFILNPIFSRFLTHTRQLSPLDIQDWPLFLSLLRTSSSPLITQFLMGMDSFTRQQLKQTALPLTPALQQSLINDFNQFLRHSTFSREELQRECGKALASPSQTAYFLTDRLCWFAVAGTVIGARLGLVFFYDWSYFRAHPAEIFKIWQGGLASHGGLIGVIIALFLYLKYIHAWVPSLTFLRLLDYVAIPTALVCCFIRLGNFMNQEILGTPTTMPWGILFGHPADGSFPIPRHPVQLYEAALYLCIFCFLWWSWKHQRSDDRPGYLFGLACALGFGGRFILEFWKANQESIVSSSFLQMGQLLSLPFVLVGIFLIWQAKRPLSDSHS